MRALRTVLLIPVVVAAGLLSGAAAGAEPTTSALIAAARPAAPVPVAVPTFPDAVAVPAAPVPAAPVPAAPVQVAPKPVQPPKPAAAPLPATPVLVPGTPCRSTARACISLSRNQTWLIKDGVVEYGPAPITHGRKGWTTPPGTFKVTFKSRHHVSTIFDNAPMPYSVFFNGGIAFHQGSLRELSHGCIHLSGAAAQKYFSSLRTGDVVQVAR